MAGPLGFWSDGTSMAILCQVLGEVAPAERPLEVPAHRRAVGVCDGTGRVWRKWHGHNVYNGREGE